MIKNSQLRNVKLYKVDILDFLKDFQGRPFDIIYLDTCGALPSQKQATLKIIGHVFLYDRLTSPGALITNFSFPPPQDIARDKERLEREKINFLVKEYMKYRLYNLSPENYTEYVTSIKTDEDKYGDYISFQGYWFSLFVYSCAKNAVAKRGIIAVESNL